MPKKKKNEMDIPKAPPEAAKEPKEKQKTPEEVHTPSGFERAVPVILFALAIFVGLCFFMDNTGTVGRFIGNALCGLFSFGAYLIPLLLIIHAIFYTSDVAKHRRLSRLIFSLVTLVSFSSCIYAVEFFGQDVPFTPVEYYTRGQALSGGGFIGSVVAFGITKIFGSVGLIIIALMVLALYVTFFFSKEGGALLTLALKCLTYVCMFFSLVEKGIKRLFGSSKEKKEKKREKSTVQRQRELMDDEFFDVDDGLARLEIAELGISQTRDERSQEENPMLHDRVIHEDAPASDARHGASQSGTQSFASERDSILEEVVSEGEYEAFVIDDITPPVRHTESTEDSAAREEAPDADTPANAPYDTPKTPVTELDAAVAFGEGFDPFDISSNRAFAERPSSAATARRTPGVTESIENISDEDIERLRRRQEFERRKAAILTKRGEPETAFSFESGTPTPKTAPDAPRSEVRQEPATVDARGDGVTPQTAEPVPDTAQQRAKVATFTFDGGAKKQSSAAARDESAFTLTIDKTPRPQPTPEPVRVGVTEGESTVFVRADKAPSQTAESFSFSTERSEDDPFQRIADMVARGEHPSLVFENPSVPDALVAEEAAEDTSAIGAIVREFETEQGMRREGSPEVRPFVPTEWTTSGYHAQNERPTLEVHREILTEPEIVPVPTEQTPPAVQTEPEPTVTPTTPYIPDDAPDAPEDEDEDDTAEIEDQIVEEDTEEDVEREYIPPEKQNPTVLEQRNLFSFLRDTDPNAQETEQAASDTPTNVDTDAEDDAEDAVLPEESEEDADDTDAPPFDGGVRKTSSRFAEYVSQLSRPEEKPKPKEEPPKQKPPVDYSDYKFPPVEFLKAPPAIDDADAQLEINSNAEKLIDTLESFRVQATIKGYDRGPRITRYEVVPARGVKVSAITNLFDNISLSLAADGVRMEAPIPGKSAIGFEIPNKKPSNVYLRDLIESGEFQGSDSKTLVCMGKDVAGTPIYGDIAKMPHVLVAGATGMGKSVCINAMMLSILFRARPDEVKFIMIDPKKVEFQPYNGIPHLLVPVVIDPKQAAGALMWAVEEMEKRFDLIEQMKVKKIDDYNERVRQNPSLGAPMPKIIIVIDELNDLMIQVRDPVENLIMRIAQKARAAGIHLIIGTQRPSVNVITGVIKANIPSRISCKVASTVDSRTILEMAGAEKLLDRGDMLFFPVTRQKPLRVQGAFVSDTEVDKILDFLREQAKGESTYDEEVLEQINRAASKCSKSKNDDDGGEDDDDEGGEGYLNDQTFLDAVNVALNAGKISTSLLQRKLSIGFGRAAKYIDIMEDLGVVSEKNGQKPRDVLINKQEWQELLARRSLD